MSLTTPPPTVPTTSPILLSPPIIQRQGARGEFEPLTDVDRGLLNSSFVQSGDLRGLGIMGRPKLVPTWQVEGTLSRAFEVLLPDPKKGRFGEVDPQWKGDRRAMRDSLDREEPTPEQIQAFNREAVKLFSSYGNWKQPGFGLDALELVSEHFKPFMTKQFMAKAPDLFEKDLQLSPFYSRFMTALEKNTEATLEWFIDQGGISGLKSRPEELPSLFDQLERQADNPDTHFVTGKPLPTEEEIARTDIRKDGVVRASSEGTESDADPREKAEEIFTLNEEVTKMASQSRTSYAARFVKYYSEQALRSPEVIGEMAHIIEELQNGDADSKRAAEALTNDRLGVIVLTQEDYDAMCTAEGLEENDRIYTNGSWMYLPLDAFLDKSQGARLVRNAALGILEWQQDRDLEP